jgi:hypothetical protein
MQKNAECEGGDNTATLPLTNQGIDYSAAAHVIPDLPAGAENGRPLRRVAT